MKSIVASTLKLKFEPVAILLSDTLPPDAMRFAKGRWGCVMAAFGAVAEKGKTYAFDRETYGCQGGGVGLGFGNAYTDFIGGVEGFYGFLSNGNDHPKGHAIAEQCSAFLRGSMREHFLHGEGYRKSPAAVEKFVRCLPLTEVPTRYVLMKPLADISPADNIASIIFLANPDQLSALLILASYDRDDDDNAIIPHAAGCQSIGIYTYRERSRPRPRAVVGHVDLSARLTLKRLGRDLLTFSVPLALFHEMEQNVPGSFLDRDTWKALEEN